MSHAGFVAKGRRVVAEAVESRLMMSVSYALSPVVASAPSTDMNNAVVMDGSGNLFGTTQFGGANNGGEIYEMAAGTNAVTALASFDSSTGVQPVGSLVFDSQGNLYGVTAGGSTNNCGAIFELPAGSGTISVLAAFDGNTNGVRPGGGLAIDGQGNLYGFNQGGGSGNLGTAYELPAGSGTISVLVDLDGSAYQPIGAPVVDTNGNLFGNAQRGGANNLGDVFEIAAASGAITVLASFDSSTIGYSPSGGLVTDSQGLLYGATSWGGANADGTIFEVDPTAQAITALASFSSTIGSSMGTLLLDGQGDLFGTTMWGGDNSMGTVFILPAGSSSMTALGSFGTSTGEPMETMPEESPLDCNLAMDPQGDLWGATGTGGPNNNGTIFEVGRVVASQVVVTQQPSDVSADATDSLVVQMEDANGNLDTSIDADVTVTIATGPDGGRIVGTTTAAAVNGVATISGLSFPEVGSYTLTISEGTLASATTGSFNVAVGAATKLVIAQQPFGAAAGATLSPVIVDIEDANGNLVTGDTSQVTLTAAPGGAATTVDAVNGVATFDHLSFTTAGSYTLAASDGSLTGAQSSAFAIHGGAASKLVITQQPAADTTGRAVSSVQVTVEDSFGNVVTGDSSNVSLTISGADPSILTGTTTVKAINGVAAFNDLSIARGGTFTLTAADGALAAAQTSAVTAPQLPSATAGTKAQTIAVTLGTGNSSGTAQPQVLHATLVSGPAGAKLFGTTSVKAKNGQASFNNLVFKKTGDYTVDITDASGTVVQEQTITVAPSVATHLQFVQQPTVQNGTISAAVALVDRYGNVVSTDTSTVTLKAGPYESQLGGTLQGTLSASAVNGVATFSGLTVTRVGLYRLIAKSAGKSLTFSTIFRVA